MNESPQAIKKLPRCGSNNSRLKRYALEGSMWNKTDLTYRISKYSSKLSINDVEYELDRAFAVWSEYTDLTFKQIRIGPVNIEIRFEEGDHGDGAPFDGPGATLAHSYFPKFGGGIHFDDSESWTVNTYSGYNFFQVAVHQIGHNLGLIHSDVKEAVMYPFYQAYQPYFKLHSDDINGIQRLYGKKTIGTTTLQAAKNNDEEISSNTSSEEQSADTTPLNTNRREIYSTDFSHSVNKVEKETPSNTTDLKAFSSAKYFCKRKEKSYGMINISAPKMPLPVPESHPLTNYRSPSPEHVYETVIYPSTRDYQNARHNKLTTSTSDYFRGYEKPRMFPV
nr:matrilysin-like [Onthophagus taurus]